MCVCVCVCFGGDRAGKEYMENLCTFFSIFRDSKIALKK